MYNRWKKKEENTQSIIKIKLLKKQTEIATYPEIISIYRVRKNYIPGAKNWSVNCKNDLKTFPKEILFS